MIAAAVRPADVIASHLATFLGPHTARVAVRTFSERAAGRAPESLTRSDVPRLLVELRPAIRTLIGSTHCESVFERIREDLGL
jgi:hypothetical protein